MNKQVLVRDVARDLGKSQQEVSLVVNALFARLATAILDGERKVYVAYLGELTFPQFSKFIAASKKDEVMAMRTLARDCFWRVTASWSTTICCSCSG